MTIFARNSFHRHIFGKVDAPIAKKELQCMNLFLSISSHNNNYMRVVCFKTLKATIIFTYGRTKESLFFRCLLNAPLFCLLT